jgi:ankyrin repeat protein
VVHEVAKAVVAALLTLGTFLPVCVAGNAAAVSAAAPFQIAFSKRLGVEVFAEDGGAGWCRPELRLRVVSQQAAFFESADFADLMRKAGSQAIAKKCAMAERALITGFTQESKDPVFSGRATRNDGWAIAAAASGAAPAGPAAAPAGAQPPEASPHEAFFRAAERGDLAAIDRFLAKGTDVNVRDLRGETALMKAAQKGQALAVYSLLGKGADVMATSQDQDTALIFAALAGDHEVVEVLLDRGADVNAKNNGGATALIVAAESGHHAMAKELLGRGADSGARDRYGQTALMGAAALGHGAVVQVLLEQGAEVNATASRGATALFFAAQGGHGAVVQTLLDRGATVEAGDDVGRTALMVAAEAGHDAVVRLLMAKGAAVSASGKDGGTPLMLAAQHGHRAVVEALLGGGAAVNLRGNAGATALSLAAWEGHLQVVQLLLDKNAEVNVRNNDGATALSSAAENGHAMIVRLLLAKGADVGLRNKYGVTALMLAALKGHAEVAKDLLGGGADVNARAEDGSTALMAAAQAGHGTIVQVLLDKGADVNAKTQDGATAQTLASRSGHEAIVKTLRAAAGSGKGKGPPLSYEQWETCRDKAVASVNVMEVGRQGAENAIRRQCGEPPAREAGTEIGVGVRPDDLVRSKTWKKKFTDLTKERYTAFVERLGVTSETVLEDGWIVGEGQVPHAGTIDEAALAIEARTGRVFAAMMVGGSRIYGFGFGESWADAPPPLQRWAQKRGLKAEVQPPQQAGTAAKAFEDPGACPFECCTYRNWQAEKDVVVRGDRRADAPEAFRVQKGEWVTALTGVVITTRPGVANVTRPVSLAGAQAKIGDTVELLTYAGEGAFTLRYRGKVIKPNLDHMNSLRVLSGPESVWWVKIRNVQGKTGWSNDPQAFGNKDACG